MAFVVKSPYKLRLAGKIIKLMNHFPARHVWLPGGYKKRVGTRTLDFGHCCSWFFHDLSCFLPICQVILRDPNPSRWQVIHLRHQLLMVQPESQRGWRGIIGVSLVPKLLRGARGASVVPGVFLIFIMRTMAASIAMDRSSSTRSWHVASARFEVFLVISKLSKLWKFRAIQLTLLNKPSDVRSFGSCPVHFRGLVVSLLCDGGRDLDLPVLAP